MNYEDFLIKRDQLQREAAQARLARLVGYRTPLWHFLMANIVRELHNRVKVNPVIRQPETTPCCTPVCCAA
jgi:hypothetical protein